MTITAVEAPEAATTVLNSTDEAAVHHDAGSRKYIDVDELLHRIDLPELVEQVGNTSLVYRNGRGEYRGKCPFHHGNNPTAFYVHQDNNGRWRWKCWACDKGGDAITFVQEIQNISDFVEAVRWLAEWGHIPFDDIGLTPEAQKKVRERKARTDILDMAGRFAAEQLWSAIGKRALTYARKRGFSDDVIRLAGFGFLDGSTALRNYLVKNNADLVLARKLGLVRKDGCDFTANGNGREASPSGWLVYTHRCYPNARRKSCDQCKTETWHVGDVCLKHGSAFNHLRKVQYLSARALSPVNPKDKSRNLPGQRLPYKAEVPGVRDVILCEGQADAESYRQLGFTAWALCGLGSLPENDVAELRRRPVVYVALDDDEEGRKKQDSLAQEIGPLAMLVPALDMDEKDDGMEIKDANDWLQAGVVPETVQVFLKKSVPWIDKQLERVQMARPHELQAITGSVATLLKMLPKELAPRYWKKAQRRLGMSRRELKGLIDGYEKKTDDSASPSLADIRDGYLTFLGEPLGNFSAKIEKELVLDDGLNPPEVRYTITGHLASGEPLIPTDVDAEDFSSLNWIGKRWGARPILYIPYGKRHLFVRAVQEVSLPDMERIRAYAHTGWTVIDGKRSFLTASGRITADGFDDSIMVDIDPHLSNYRLPPPPKGSERYGAIKASLDFLGLGPYQVTAPIWAAMYAAPLTEVMPLYTVLWVYGSTQSGKSTIVHLALTHFGKDFIDGRQYHAPTDWMSTVTHLEESMFTTKDLPLVIDDFTPQFHSIGDSRKMHAAANRVIRGVGNRSARGRSRKYQRQTLVPRSVVISTAELPLPGESTVGRMLYVSIARGDILPDSGGEPREALNKAQKQGQQGLYALAMSAYIQWLADHWDDAMAKLAEIREDSMNYFRTKGDIQNRLPDYFVTLDSAQQLALRAFYDMGVISSDDAARISHRIGEALAAVVISQAEKIAAESPVRKFFEALNSLLERRKVYLSPRTKSYVYIPPVYADLVGWADPNDDIIYLDDGACLEYVRTYWAGLGENFDTTTDALRRQISQVSGLLADRGRKQVQVSKWLAGKSRRALAVDKQSVARLYGFTLQNEPGIPGDEPENEQIQGV